MVNNHPQTNKKHSCSIIFSGPKKKKNKNSLLLKYLYTHFLAIHSNTPKKEQK